MNDRENESERERMRGWSMCSWPMQWIWPEPQRVPLSCWQLERPLTDDRPELDEKRSDCWQELLWFGLTAVISVRWWAGGCFTPDRNKPPSKPLTFKEQDLCQLTSNLLPTDGNNRQGGEGVYRWCKLSRSYKIKVGQCFLFHFYLWISLCENINTMISYQAERLKALWISFAFWVTCVDSPGGHQHTIQQHQSLLFLRLYLEQNHFFIYMIDFADISKIRNCLHVPCSVKRFLMDYSIVS